MKTVDEGRVSTFLAHRAGPGTIVTLSDVEGEYVLPDPPPEKLLFISAGSGVTPIMSMLRRAGVGTATATVFAEQHAAARADDQVVGRVADRDVVADEHRLQRAGCR